MDQKKFSKIIQKAQKDPKFLHQLIFKPESAIKELDDSLDRQMLGNMISKNPAEIIAKTIGILQACGNTCTSSCDNTCGKSCGYTTNIVDNQLAKAAQAPFFSRFNDELAACGYTCTYSCDNTCGGSCGYTTNLTDAGGFGSFNQSFR